MDETGQDRNYSPRDHDSRYPLSRTPAFNNDGSRYLEQNVGQVEHTHAETIDTIAEAQVDAHSEIGEGNIDAIKVIHDVNDEHERKQPAGNSAPRSRAKLC